MRIEARVPDEVLQRIRAPFRRLDAAGAKPERIDPPVIQPLDLLLDLSGEAMRERLFVVQGEDGSEACLRPDFTVPVVRHHLARAQAQASYYYQGQAFRIAPLGQAERHPSEFLQIGVETFGGAGDEVADAALAGLAWESALAGGRDDLSLRIGDVGFFRALLADIGVPDAIAHRLRRAFTRPRRLKAEIARASRAPAERGPLATASQIEAMWAQLGVEETGGRTAQAVADRLAARQAEDALPRLSDEQTRRIEDYLSISGPPDEVFKRLGDVARGDAFSQESRWWSLLIEQLPARGVPADRIVFDAGFGGPFSYYDGLVFEIVSDALGADAAVAAGGRYDTLLAQLAGGGDFRAAGCMVRPARAWNGARS